MMRIIDVVHRDNVRLVRALRRFRDTFERGQIVLAQGLFASIDAHAADCRKWEQSVIHRIAQGSGSTEDLRLLVRDDLDHGRIAALFDQVRDLLQRSVEGEMALDQSVLAVLDELEDRLEAHAGEVEEPLCAVVDRALPPDVAADVAERVASRWLPAPGA